jgi:polyisoprenoid-binding protein YceI
MKRILFAGAMPALVFVLAGFQMNPGAAQLDPPSDKKTFTVDVAHSSVGFKARHLGITNVNGHFRDYEATVSLDPADISTLEASAVIQVASVDTGVDRRDGHLKSDDFFDAEGFPEMTFVSKEVRNIDGNMFELVGDLTIRGTTQEVVLEGEMLGMADLGESTAISFEAMGTVNRFEYGLKWDRLTEAGGFVVSEDIKIILEIQARG